MAARARMQLMITWFWYRKRPVSPQTTASNTRGRELSDHKQRVVTVT